MELYRSLLCSFLSGTQNNRADPFISSFRELMQSCGFRRPSVCPSVCKLLRKSLLLPQTWLDRHQTYTTCHAWSPHGTASRVCWRSRSTVEVKSHVIRALLWCYCYTVPSDVLSLHALTLRSIVTLSFHYKCQTARCNVYCTSWNELLRHWRSG